MQRHCLTGVGGAVYAVELDPDARVAEDRGCFAGRMFTAVETGALTVTRDGARVALDALWLADFHLLRDLAERRGTLATTSRERGLCRNCGARLPLVDGPLEPLLVPQEGPEFDGEPEPARFDLAEPRGGLRGFELRPVRVKDARPLLRFVQQPDAAFKAPIARGLGLTAVFLEQETRRSARAIAEVLAEAPDDVLDAIAAAYISANYPLRCCIPTRCARCDAMHDVPTPAERELEGAWDALDGHFDVGAFPSFAEFAELARRISKDVYARNEVRNLELVVDDGVPAVDDGGEPLLGSYQPRHDGVGATFTEVRFVITLYYRTFEAMFVDAPYDVAAEIDETIDHEIEHHLHHLSGHDPLDAEERAEARRELERTYGKETVRRAEEAALARELAGMGRFFFWGLLVCGALLGIAIGLGIIE